MPVSSAMCCILVHAFNFVKTLLKFVNELTDGLIRNKRLVIKTEDFGDIVEIGMLSHQCPLCVIQPIVEVGDSDFGTPVVLVVKLDMPMYSNWTHVASALQQRCVVLPRRIDSHCAQQVRVATAMINHPPIRHRSIIFVNKCMQILIV